MMAGRELDALIAEVMGYSERVTVRNRPLRSVPQGGLLMMRPYLAMDTYRTCDEITFIRELKERNPEAYRNYIGIVLEGRRSWPEGVDGKAIVAAIRKMEGG